MNKEPFLQVSKRRNKAGWQERLLIRFIALILALIVCGAVIVALVKMNPVDVYKAIWDGAMGSERRIWQTIRDTMILLCIAIGLAPAFKMEHRCRRPDPDRWSMLCSSNDLCRGQNVTDSASDRNVYCKCHWRHDLGNDPGSIQGILEYQ